MSVIVHSVSLVHAYHHPCHSRLGVPLSFLLSSSRQCVPSVAPGWGRGFAPSKSFICVPVQFIMWETSLNSRDRFLFSISHFPNCSMPGNRIALLTRGRWGPWQLSRPSGRVRRTFPRLGDVEAVSQWGVLGGGGLKGVVIPLHSQHRGLGSGKHVWPACLCICVPQLAFSFPW